MFFTFVPFYPSLSRFIPYLSHRFCIIYLIPHQAARDTINNYPAIAPLYQAGDPRIHQPIDAMATMLAMVSGQVEVALSEPFEKVRDATILADAALKGIIRKAIPARVSVSATNKNATPFDVASGATIIDSNGNPYIVDTPITIPPGVSTTFNAVQYKLRTINHTVSGSAPFYAIDIPPSPEDLFLAGITLSDSSGNVYEYAPKFTGIAAGERVYHIEVDEYKRMFIRLG